MVSFMVSFSTCVLFKYFVSICNNTEINNEMQNETLTDRGNYFVVCKLELELLVIKYQINSTHVVTKKVFGRKMQMCAFFSLGVCGVRTVQWGSGNWSERCSNITSQLFAKVGTKCLKSWSTPFLADIEYTSTP